ncbi:TRAP transporter small permease [Sedimentitalea sp.]|uniref:TRAP transporter small permease n=1 Tax=Sedimentitalea sp. TaxID=2048915 RepID=UPI00329944A5
MFVVSYDAVARYAMNAPIPWAYELISYYLLVAAIYFSVSYTFKSGDHINIDLFRRFMSNRLTAMLDVIWSLLAAAVFGLISFGAWEAIAHAINKNEFLPGYITWPAWPAFLPIAIGGGAVTLRLVVHAFSLLVYGKDDEVFEHFEMNGEEGRE